MKKYGGGKFSYSFNLRQKAELALTLREHEPVPKRSESDILRLVHELEVHQIELEMQNDELLMAKEQAELATPKYVELYEFAPSGYFILSREGQIIQLNLAGSQLFGKERSQLNNHPFAIFISSESKPDFKLFLSRVFSSNIKETCVLSLITANSLPVQVQLSAFAEPNKEECFVSVVVDITEQKKVEKKLVLANEELAVQNEENTKRVAELVLANKELSFQDSEKSKRAAELIIANKELLFQNNEKAKRAEELILANIELLFQNDEKAKRATELILANKELLLSNDENAKLAVELLLANKELIFQNDEKSLRSDELILANIKLLFQNKKKEKRATELVVANKLVAAQRDRLEEISSLVPGIVFQYCLRPDGSSFFPYASDAIRQIYRVTPEKAREDASNVFLNLHPDDYDAVLGSLQTSAKELLPWQQEYRVKFDDGTIRNLFGNSMPQRQENGSILWYGFITDITDKKKIEHQLEDLLKGLKILYALSQLAGETDIALDTLCQRLVYLLPEGFQYSEITCARIVVNGVEFRTENFKDSAWKLSTPLLENESVIGIIEVAYLVEKAEEDEGPFHKEERILIDTVAKQLHQIIMRKKIEYTLSLEESKLRAITESANDAILMMDEQGLLSFWNTAASQMFGYTYEEAIGQKLYDLITPKHHHLVANNAIPLFLRTGRGDVIGKTTEAEAIRKDGQYIEVEFSISSLYFNNTKNTVIIVKEITERKTAEVEVKLQNEKLLKLNSERDKFFSIIAHDLRGPLGGFMGLSEMLADKDQDFTDNERNEMALELSLSARNTFNLLENLLEWSHMNHGISEFKPQKLGLIKAVNDCINSVAEPARGKEIALIVDIPAGHEVFGDKNMLQTVIRNLLSNAVKFTPKGGLVTISAKPTDNQMMVISVKDTGIGMSDQMRNDLFRIDANTRRPGTNGEKSTGLGLLLCREFVAKQGGELWVESEQFKGTIFSFTIPSIGPTGDEMASPEVDFAEKPVGQLNNLKILIAEDDEISAKLIHRIVKEFSREVFHAKTGNEAVEICRNNPDIDLILMDIAMPGMDGFEATHQIRLFNQKLIIIAQTTFALSADREKAFEVGFNDYIVKPFGKEPLIELIKKHISK